MNRKNVTKRSHMKSKYGCTNCKKRRVKCDELFPSCKACVRREEECVYLKVRPEQGSSCDDDEVKGDVKVYDNDEFFTINSISSPILNNELIFSDYHEYNQEFNFNNKSVGYFKSIFDLNLVKSWNEISNLIIEYPNLNKILLLNYFMKLCYDTWDNNYLIISQLNYDLFTGIEFNNNIKSKLLITILELLYILLSPNLTILDPSFINNCCQVNNLTIELMISDQEPQVSMQLYLQYSTLANIENINYNYFPNYLYQLITLGDEDDNLVILQLIESLHKEYCNYDNDSIKLILKWPMTLNEKFTKLIQKNEFRSLILMAHYLMLVSSQCSDICNGEAIRDELKRIDLLLDSQYKGWLLLPKRICNLV